MAPLPEAAPPGPQGVLARPLLLEELHDVISHGAVVAAALDVRLHQDDARVEAVADVQVVGAL